MRTLLAVAGDGFAKPSTVPWSHARYMGDGPLAGEHVAIVGRRVEWDERYPMNAPVHMTLVVCGHGILHDVPDARYTMDRAEQFRVVGGLADDWRAADLAAMDAPPQPDEP